MGRGGKRGGKWRGAGAKLDSCPGETGDRKVGGKVARKGRLNVRAPLFLFCPGASDLEAAELQSACRPRPLCLSGSLGGRRGEATAASLSRSLLQLPPPRPSHLPLSSFTAWGKVEPPSRRAQAQKGFSRGPRHDGGRWGRGRVQGTQGTGLSALNRSCAPLFSSV